MSEVECPHCEEDFDVYDHHESGPYECPCCGRKIHIEVEYEPIYSVSCLEKDREFVDSRSHPAWQFCQRCGEAKLKEPVEGNSTGRNDSETPNS